MDPELDDFPTIDSNDPVFKMLMKLPIAFDWIEYKGETVFAGVNYEATKKAGKPMLDIFYCATKAMNDCVLFTTQYDKNKFKESPLAHCHQITT